MNPEDVEVKDIMTTDVVVAYPGETISKAISKMQEHGFHELPVVDEKGNLLGMINYRTLIRRKSISLFSRVDTIMVKPPVVNPDNTMVVAVKKMIDAGFRSLPVVNRKGKLVGILSRTDVIRVVPELTDVASMAVEDVMTSDPECVSENTPVEYAVDMMKKISELSLPVIDDNGRLSGVVHMRDISRAIWRARDRVKQGEYTGEKEKKVVYVKEVMSPPVYVPADATLKDAVEKMIEFKSSICVIVDDDMKPEGVISQRDVMESVIRKGKTEGVFVQITGLDIEDPEPYMTIYNMVENFLNRINKFKDFKPQLLTFHVEEHHTTSDEIKYSVRARFSTDRKQFFAKSYDWNLYRAIRDVLDILERNVRKENEKLKEFRKVTL
ncbi:MAG: CBS domain-containing protein [Euryarchaeota archaeon]|nr:CBS domain-containing protein [Euryarchaeota archaeon]